MIQILWGKIWTAGLSDNVLSAGGGIIRTCILGNLLGFSDIQAYGSVFFGNVCRIRFGANRSDDICGIHRNREK